MGNNVSTHQGNLPSHGIRDVIDAANKEQHDWSELAEARITKQPSTTLLSPRKRHTYNMLRVQKKDNINFVQK